MNQSSKKRNSRSVRDKLVRDNAGFVYWMVKRYQKYAEKDELVGAGFEGLLEAASRYDISKGKFTTYALHWVRMEMLKVSYQQHPVQLPSHHVFKTTKDSLRHEVDDVWWMRLHHTQLSPAEHIEIRSTRDFLHRAVALLTPQQRYVIEMRFGLNGRTRLTLKEAGQAIGLSRERARQIQEDALTYLREEHGINQ